MTGNVLLKALVRASKQAPTKIVTRAYVAPGEAPVDSDQLWGPDGIVTVLEADNVPKGKVWFAWKDRPVVKAPDDCLVVDAE